MVTFGGGEKQMVTRLMLQVVQAGNLFVLFQTLIWLLQQLAYLMKKTGAEKK